VIRQVATLLPFASLAGYHFAVDHQANRAIAGELRILAGDLHGGNHVVHSFECGSSGRAVLTTDPEQADRGCQNRLKTAYLPKALNGDLGSVDMAKIRRGDWSPFANESQQ